MKQLFVSLLFIAMMTLSGCVDKTPLAQEHKNFAGKWVANDGTWIHLFNDGGGSFELSNSSVSGGAAEITDYNISIGLMGIEADFAIDKSPYQEDGDWLMVLDGNVYVKR